MDNKQVDKALQKSARLVLQAVKAIARSNANALCRGLLYEPKMLDHNSVTKNNAKVNDVIKTTNYSSGTTLACFSCHEARGTGSIAKYLAKTF